MERKVKDSFYKRENEKLTFTPLFITAIVKALRDYPALNGSINGDKIVVKKDINPRMATALNGNLIVPVIKNADHLNLVGLTKAVNDLANRARTNNLKPDEIKDGNIYIYKYWKFWFNNGDTNNKSTPSWYFSHWSN